MKNTRKGIICYPAKKTSEGWAIKNEIPLGEGYFSDIFRVCKENNCEYVIKLVKNEFHDHIKNEVKIQKMCSEKGLCLPVIDWWLCPTSKEYGGVIISPVVKENLENYLRKNQDREKLWGVMKKVLKVIFDLHQMGIAHRNIKLNHFMVDSEKIYLIDLKDAKTMNKENEGLIYLDYFALNSMILENPEIKYDILLGIKDEIEDYVSKNNDEDKEISILEAEEKVVSKILNMNYSEVKKFSEKTRNNHKNFVGIEQLKRSLRYMPGEHNGDLLKFKEWGLNGEWEKFGHDHSKYDWWMFPIDRPSDSKGWKYVVLESDIRELSQDRTYILDYLTGVRILIKSWGWSLRTGEPYPDPEEGQKWKNWDTRLRKVSLSLKLFRQKELFEDLKKYVEYLLKHNMLINGSERDEIIRIFDLEEDTRF